MLTSPAWWSILSTDAAIHITICLPETARMLWLFAVDQVNLPEEDYQATSRVVVMIKQMCMRMTAANRIVVWHPVPDWSRKANQSALSKYWLKRGILQPDMDSKKDIKSKCGFSRRSVPRDRKGRGVGCFLQNGLNSGRTCSDKVLHTWPDLAPCFRDIGWTAVDLWAGNDVCVRFGLRVRDEI